MAVIGSQECEWANQVVGVQSCCRQVGGEKIKKKSTLIRVKRVKSAKMKN
jgi:hypothetical protein